MKPTLFWRSRLPARASPGPPHAPAGAQDLERIERVSYADDRRRVAQDYVLREGESVSDVIRRLGHGDDRRTRPRRRDGRVRVAPARTHRGRSMARWLWSAARHGCSPGQWSGRTWPSSAAASRGRPTSCPAAITSSSAPPTVRAGAVRGAVAYPGTDDGTADCAARPLGLERRSASSSSSRCC